MTYTLTKRDSVWSLIVSPIIWACHFLIAYILASVLCAKGLNRASLFGLDLVLVVVCTATVIALGAIGYAGYVAWSRWGADGKRTLPPHDEDTVGSRRRFMAFAALLLSGLSFTAVVYQTLPVVFILRCV